MRYRPLHVRAFALMGAVWVQFVLAGPGLHDPNCAHHLPGASGTAHRHGQQLDAMAPGHKGHHGASTDDAVPAQSGGPKAPADPDAGDCSCLGVCVPGALVGLTLSGARADATLPATVMVADRTPAVQALPLPHRAPLLPPSTGPPTGA